jgi:hypothetical protein
MLALNALRGDSWAPASPDPDLNPCDFFLLGTLKELVDKPWPANLSEMKEKVKLAFSDLPESIVVR